MKEARSPNAVAPLEASTPSILSKPATQTMFPDILVGYAKNKNALAVRATFKIFIPVPPKTSLPITTAKMVAAATIHNGTSAGIIKGISIPETKNPS